MSSVQATLKELSHKLAAYQAVVLFSGGTDSTISALLTQERVGKDAKVLLLTLDTGIGEEEVKKSIDRANLLGMDHIMYDGIDEFCNTYIASAIKMNADYQGFPLGTPLARCMAFDIAIKCLSSDSEDTRLLVIGSTKRQNTRLRAERILKEMPGMEVYAPIADQNLSRDAKVEMLRTYNVPVKQADNFSTDENLWSRCTESHLVNKLQAEYDPEWFQLTIDILDAVDQPEIVELEFAEGLPVAVNGEPLKLSDVIRRLNDIGRVHGLGRIINVEDTAFGDKIRSIYEAPGAEIILKSHAFIESLVLNKWERDRKALLDKRWGEIIYNGEWFAEERRAIESEVMPWQYKVNGTLKLRLYKGNITVVDGDLPESLLLKKEKAGLY
ncbi:MAG: argininosuccinate synthase domain-containing protein [Tumebacillaceae bacterium]